MTNEGQGDGARRRAVTRMCGEEEEDMRVGGRGLAAAGSLAKLRERGSAGARDALRFVTVAVVL